MFNRTCAIWIACAAVACTSGCRCEIDASYNDPHDTDTDGDSDSLPDPIDPDDLQPDDRCLSVKEIQTTEVMPAGVRTVFQLLDCQQNPVTDLLDSQVQILLDGKPLNSEGGTTPVVAQEINVERYALMLLDLSDSIVASGHLIPMLSAAREAIHILVAQGHRVAIYQFAGPKYFGQVQAFTEQVAALDAALDRLANTSGLGSTDLYGAIVKAVDILEMTGNLVVLTSRGMVLFTDGTDEAMEVSRASALSSVQRPHIDVFTVGLGGDVDKAELAEFGKSGFEWSTNTLGLTTAFADIARRIDALSRSQYLIGVCSPRTSGSHDMSVVVQRGVKWGSVTVDYNADGFDIVGCDANAVAFPCYDKECGKIDGIQCGTCSADAYCNGDYQCEIACTPEIECGTVFGIDCGDCSEHGSNFGCDANNACVDACAQAECGSVLGVDCGSCDTGFECNADNACVPISVPNMRWKYIDGGTVTLGCDLRLDARCDPDTEGRRRVMLSDYWMMDSEITVDMYATCVHSGGCSPALVNTGGICNYAAPGRGDHPINCISWEGVQQFCRFIGGSLATEAQWERAYRGDHDGELASYWQYPWGSSPVPSCSQVVMYRDDLGCGRGLTHSIRTTPTTSFELHNMGGNVTEWVLDHYSETFEDCDGEPCENPTGPSSGDSRVLRGGSLNDAYAASFRTAKRDKADPLTRSPEIGGRCVRSVQQ